MMFDDTKLKTLLNSPLTGTPLEICSEIQRRLQEVRHYEPIVASLYDQHQAMIRNGDYSIPREMLYASMAWFLLKAKVTSFEMCKELAACTLKIRVIDPNDKIS